jgi:hypothetical protein
MRRGGLESCAGPELGTCATTVDQTTRRGCPGFLREAPAALTTWEATGAQRRAGVLGDARRRVVNWARPEIVPAPGGGERAHRTSREFAVSISIFGAKSSGRNASARPGKDRRLDPRAHSAGSPRERISRSTCSWSRPSVPIRSKILPWQAGWDGAHQASSLPGADIPLRIACRSPGRVASLALPYVS